MTESPSLSGQFRAFARARVHGKIHPRHTPPRVLVAEDDSEMRRLVVEVLRGEGFEIVEACDGGRLLVQVTSIYAHPEGDFDLIVTDIRMPICTGLQIVKGLRDARWTVPVILMTAFGDESVRASADALGAVLFDKPFLIDDLRAAALELLTQP